MQKKLAYFLIIKKFFAAEDFHARNQKKKINRRNKWIGIGFEPHENINQIMEILNKYLTNVTLNHYLNSAPKKFPRNRRK